MASHAGYKVCPECRVEYRPDILRCADCGADLVHPEDLTDAAGAGSDAFPPADQLECVRVAPIAWMRALSHGLQEQGITHRVEPARAEDAPEGQRPDVFGDVDLFGLYVEAHHAGAARELDGTMAAQLIPEEAPPLGEGELEACPACGAALAPEAVECPDCGLGFG